MDFSAMCRTCLSTDSLNPIFVKNIEHKRYARAIFIITGLKVELNDGMPQQICTCCITQLNNSLKFRKQCKKAKTEFLQLKSANIKKTEHTENTLSNKNNESSREFKTNEVVLKIELKTQEPSEINNSVSIKPEDSDIENDTPLSCLTDKDSHNNGHSDELVNKSEELENSKICDVDEKKAVERVSCPECHKELSARSLRAHVSRHAAAARGVRGPGAGLRCGYCKTEHSNMEALSEHSAACPFKKKRRICESSRVMVNCEFCDKAMQRASLRAHVAVQHEGLGPVCEHCGRRFGNKLRLREHLRAKHGHEKLRCSHCDFTSASNAALQNHERRHRGEKPFVCEACGAKFHAAYLLAQHRQTHRTDKRVKCALCGAVFKASHSLHAHRLARHGARAHGCPLCARAFACRHYAVKHLRAVHGLQGPVPPLQVEPAPL